MLHYNLARASLFIRAEVSTCENKLFWLLVISNGKHTSCRHYISISWCVLLLMGIFQAAHVQYSRQSFTVQKPQATIWCMHMDLPRGSYIIPIVSVQWGYIPQLSPLWSLSFVNEHSLCTIWNQVRLPYFCNLTFLVHRLYALPSPVTVPLINSFLLACTLCGPNSPFLDLPMLFPWSLIVLCMCSSI